MKADAFVNVAFILGLIGAIASVLLLAMSGSGDDPEMLRTFFIVSAIVFSFSILAAVILER